MNQAKNTPVNRPQREVDSRDVEIQQRESRDLDMPQEQESIELVEGADDKADYIAELAFMEEPVTILIAKGGGKNPAKVMQCWVQGKGAEQLINGKWAVCGWLPVGARVVTRRKYLEVIARAKSDTISTRVVVPTNKDEDYQNFADVNSSSAYPVTTFGDSARGNDWFNRIVGAQ